MFDELHQATLRLRNNFKAAMLDAPAMIVLRDERQGNAFRYKIQQLLGPESSGFLPRAARGEPMSDAIWWEFTINGIIVRWPANATAERAVQDWCKDAGAQA